VARESLPNGGTVIVSTTITPNPELKDEPSPASDTGEFVQIRIIIEGAPASPPQIELPVIPAIEHIIQQHKGHIRVQPTSENRCELCLYLPRHLENHTTAPDHLSTEVHGHETVLLVEPDPAVRIASRMILENFGYHVLDADTGESALDRAATSNHTVQVLLTDACLADIGGPQLAAQLKARYPALKVLLMSAASDADLMRLQANVDDDVFIRKPFDARSLARHIRTVMDTKNQIPLEQSTVIT